MTARRIALPSGPSAFRAVRGGPEQLVGIGFRCWFEGQISGDIASWEKAWELYAGRLGAARAKTALGELGLWVRTIQSLSGRPISVAPSACPGFCRDECVAIAMVAASQHKVCPAMRACAFALIECSEVEQLMDATDRFAITLDAMNQRLDAASICQVTCLATPPRGVLLH